MFLDPVSLRGKWNPRVGGGVFMAVIGNLVFVGGGLFDSGVSLDFSQFTTAPECNIICLFVSFIRQRCVRHNSSSFCKYIRMMIYLLALTKVFLLFLIFCYFMMFLMFSDYFFHLLFVLIFWT